jgi:hypothetical protein
MSTCSSPPNGYLSCVRLITQTKQPGQEVPLTGFEHLAFAERPLFSHGMRAPCMNVAVLLLLGYGFSTGQVKKT